MAFDFGNLNASADSASNRGTGKNVRAGRYSFRIDSIAEAKTQRGEAKYEVACTIVGQADGLSDMIGITRKQHFVHGHSKADVAKNYEADFLALLRNCGVDLNQVRNLGELYMATKDVEARKPILVYDVAPQEKDPKYLNWRHVKEAAPAPAAAPAAAIPGIDPLFAR